MVFTASANYSATSVKVYIHENVANGGSATLTASIYSVDANSHPSTQLCTGTLDITDLAASYEWKEVTFTSPYTLVNETQYCIVLEHSTANDIGWGLGVNGGYTGGNNVYSANDGLSWTTDTEDMMFSVWGVAPVPTDKTYSKALVAIANSEVWYETTAGTTMTELADANNDINTAEPLMACEAFQKLFIVNKTNLKVMDFINTKLTITALTTPPTKGSIVTQASSTATMIVDFVNSGMTEIYGYVTSGTFVTTAGYTLSGGSMTPETRVPSTVTAPTTPHWHNWTVYAGDTSTYGTMLSQPTIVCLYRGRLVVSGDSTVPHQWQMAKIENPWSVKYDSTVPLSGLKGGDADIGEIGDIVTTLIPYKDDLLVIGCAGSIWVIIGDPTAGGQLAEVSLATGIWGSRAWCIDDKGNLYFLGNDGIYRVPLGTSMPPPENISRLNMPNLIADLDLDKSLHRIVLGYDPFNYGILITRTLISDGTNTGYWFDLTTQGFYPESYPMSCGIFSMFHYQATDDTYNKFLLGCNDGYIREFDGSTENDATTSSTTPINSYCTILQKIAKDSDTEGKLTSLTAITAGGGSGGDTDSVTYSLYKGDSAEEVLNKITSGATVFATGSWTTVGKQYKVRQRMRGTWIGIKLSDATASKTWAIEKLYGNVEPAGKI